MHENHRRRLPAWVSEHFADACLLAALLLVLGLSWQGPPRSTPSGLKAAARETLARQVGQGQRVPATGLADAPAAQAADDEPPARRPAPG